MKNDEISTRIKSLRCALNLNQSAFAREINIPRTTLIGYESGASLPSEMLTILNKKFNVNIHWLLTGEGDMFLPGYTPDTIQREKPLEPKKDIEENQPIVSEEKSLDQSLHSSMIAPYPEDTGMSILADPRDITVYKFKKGCPEPVAIEAPDPEGTVLIPLYSQTASAGPGQEPNQLIESEISIPVIYRLLGSHRPQYCGLVRVVGDSMADLGLFNGDYVAFDRSDIKGDGIFVITMFSETRVKRLQYRLTDKKIIIKSENAKRYPDPEEVDHEAVLRGDLLIHGRVFAWFHMHPY